ncbi:MAG: hypothetical protein PHS02_04825 [Candidatus ainarchaeum sp.]|nr:hypothetical protein [Candidatus ainarchaeum sp.]
MSLRKILNDTEKEWKRNTWLIFIFSVMFVISMLALFLAPSPTYLSLGGSFLRVGSIPEMNAMDVAVVVLAYLLSLFIFADAITNINLLIKANRTQNKIPKEIFSGIFKYAVKVFLIYTIAVLLALTVNVATFDSPYHNIIYPLLSFIFFLAVFFVPPAIVVDDMDTFRAVALSAKMVVAKWKLVLLWVVAALFVMSFVELTLFLLIPVSIAKYLVLAVNGLLLIPILTIFQTQVYLEKYPLSP